jgi:hypothetical protein
MSFSSQPYTFGPGSNNPAGITVLWASGNTITLAISPSVSIRYLWFPEIPGVINVYIGSDTSGPLYYVVEPSGSEGVPITPSALFVTLEYPGGFPGDAYVFARNWACPPVRSGSFGPSVTSVGAAAPITSTGGSTPIIGLETPLPIADGGTGTATPALIAGAGIDITGTDFDWTVSSTATGTVVEVTATAPIQSSGGIDPNISLQIPLEEAYGGTGVTAVLLTAGTGIDISGTWPDNTFAIDPTEAVTSVNGQVGAVVFGSADNSVTITPADPSSPIIDLKVTDTLAGATSYKNFVSTSSTTGTLALGPLPGTGAQAYIVRAQVYSSLVSSSQNLTLTGGSGATWNPASYTGENGSGAEAQAIIAGTAVGGATVEISWAASVGIGGQALIAEIWAYPQ